jgi:hypothetical protein
LAKVAAKTLPVVGHVGPPPLELPLLEPLLLPLELPLLDPLELPELLPLELPELLPPELPPLDPPDPPLPPLELPPLDPLDPLPPPELLEPPPVSPDPLEHAPEAAARTHAHATETICMDLMKANMDRDAAEASGRRACSEGFTGRLEPCNERGPTWISPSSASWRYHAREPP